MLSKMKNLPLALYLILYLTQAGAALPEKLGCKGNSMNPKIEQELITQLAAGVVKRVSKNHLTIHTNNGPKDFYDKPPHDKLLEGVHHYFCNRFDGFVIIMLNNINQVTLVSVDEVSGHINRGGENVWLSQDRRAYLFSEHFDGMDGFVWSVYSLNGKKTWTGYNFIPRGGPSLTSYAELSDPIWTETGELTAQASCSSNLDIKWRVKLVKRAGVWDWRPRKSCF